MVRRGKKLSLTSRPLKRDKKNKRLPRILQFSVLSDSPNKLMISVPCHNKSVYHNLVTGLVRTDSLVFTWADLTGPSFPGKVCTIRPIGHLFRGCSLPAIRTTSPFWKFLFGCNHLCNCKMGRYSRTQRFQNWSDKNWTCLQRFP